MRFIGAVAAIVLVSLGPRSTPLTAQASPTLAPVLKFEVASVKVLAGREGRAPMLWQPPGHFTAGVPILSLVSIGYLMPVYRIDGLPDWARTTYFEINARTERQVDIDERPASTGRESRGDVHRFS